MGITRHSRSFRPVREAVRLGALIRCVLPLPFRGRRGLALAGLAAIAGTGTGSGSAGPVD